MVVQCYPPSKSRKEPIQKPSSKIVAYEEVSLRFQGPLIEMTTVGGERYMRKLFQFLYPVMCVQCSVAELPTERLDLFEEFALPNDGKEGGGQGCKDLNQTVKLNRTDLIRFGYDINEFGSGRFLQNRLKRLPYFFCVAPLLSQQTCSRPPPLPLSKSYHRSLSPNNCTDGSPTMMTSMATQWQHETELLFGGTRSIIKKKSL